MKRLIIIMIALMGCWAVQAQEMLNALIFQENMPGHDKALIQMLDARFQAAGYRTALCDTKTISEKLSKADMLILPNAAHLPANILKSVSDYLEHGGDLMALKIGRAHV